jgi:hypothetical protein
VECEVEAGVGNSQARIEEGKGVIGCGCGEGVMVDLDQGADEWGEVDGCAENHECILA